MSQIGNIAFVSNLKGRTVGEALDATLEFVGSPKVLSYLLHRPAADAKKSGIEAFPNGEEWGDPIKTIRDLLPRDMLAIVTSKGPEYVQLLSLGRGTLIKPAARELATFPKELRGDFDLSRIYLLCGRHSHAEEDSDSKWVEMGRGVFSVVLMGYGTPTDSLAMREAFMKNKYFQKLEEDFAKILGDAKRCIYWEW